MPVPSAKTRRIKVRFVSLWRSLEGIAFKSITYERVDRMLGPIRHGRFFYGAKRPERAIGVRDLAVGLAFIG